MLKFVVLCAVVAMASAKPGLWGNGLVGGWGSPLVGSSLVGAPVVSAYSTGISSWGASPLVSNLGVAPVVSAYSAPAVVAAPSVLVGSEPALAPGVPAIVTKATGRPVDTLDVVVNRNNHLVAKSLAAHGIQKRSAIAPLGLATPLAASWGAPVATSWGGPVATSWGGPVATSWGVSSPLVSSSIVSPLAARSIISPVGIRAW